MIRAFICAFVVTSICIACSSTSTSIFGHKTPLEKYKDKLEESGLEKTAEGRLWLAASQNALQFPVTVQLPYKQIGAFSSIKPQAVGLKFTAKQGQRLLFNFTKANAANFVLYAELYKLDATGKTTLLQSPDTNAADLNVDILETATYLLKIQPQLSRVGHYDLSIATGPSLGFPVADKKAYIGSVWGDERDGGKRSHEGVDIFAPKRTPAVAAADGRVVGVREGGLGGKTIWLRPQGQNVTLYYAHLDEQLVKEGQAVKKGDTVGLVGNTGNAKYTPSHLHFGIYSNAGALNPFPFVDRQINKPSSLPQKKLAAYVRVTKSLKTPDLQIEKNTVLTPLAFTAEGYIAELPNGHLVEVPFTAVQSVLKPLKTLKTISTTALYKAPVNEIDSPSTILEGSPVSVVGYFNEYTFVRWGESEGWILNTSLED